MSINNPDFSKDAKGKIVKAVKAVLAAQRDNTNYIRPAHPRGGSVSKGNRQYQSYQMTSQNEAAWAFGPPLHPPTGGS